MDQTSATASRTFVDLGYQKLPDFFDAAACRKLLATAMATRNIADIFLGEAEFRKEQKFKGVNPRPGRNLAEKLDTNFIFSDPRFAEEMRKVCGDKWRVLDYKFVMGVPHKYTPDWLNAELSDRLVANLGAYVKEAYRDITYFRGIDFHQDIIDFPDRDSDFITAYLYLDEVVDTSSPLYVLSKSHLLGATPFPHRLEVTGEGEYTYASPHGEVETCRLEKLTGGGGSLYYWHSSTLHGTQPQSHDEPRLSLRILVERNAKSAPGSLLDEANQSMRGPLSLTKTREDLGPGGQAILKGNTINKTVR